VLIFFIAIQRLFSTVPFSIVVSAQLIRFTSFKV